MTPAVSVVMAAKNYARFLPMAVASVQAQTFADWELVIINDGSADDTDAVVKPLLADSRIRYFESDALGQSRAKNLGVRLSRGGIVAFLDADDAWRPTKLAKQMPRLTGRVGVVHCERDLIDEDVDSPPWLCREGLGEGGDLPSPTPLQTVESNQPRRLKPAATGSSVSSQFCQSLTGHRDFHNDIYIRNPICFSSTILKREVFDFIGGFDPRLDLSIDYDFWLRVAKHYDFASVPQRLVLYRTGHGNLSKKLADRIATAFGIMHRHAAGLDAATRDEAYAMTCRSMAWAVRGAEPRLAARWYLKALAWPHRRHESLKGLLGIALDGIGRRTRSTSAENLTVNV